MNDYPPPGGEAYKLVEQILNQKLQEMEETQALSQRIDEIYITLEKIITSQDTVMSLPALIEQLINVQLETSRHLAELKYRQNTLEQLLQTVIKFVSSESKNPKLGSSTVKLPAFKKDDHK